MRSRQVEEIQCVGFITHGSIEKKATTITFVGTIKGKRINRVGSRVFTSEVGF